MQQPSPQQPAANPQPVVQPQAQFQQQPPQRQPEKQKPPKAAAPTKTGPVPFIALGISVIALILAIVGFILPKASQTPEPVESNTPKIVSADMTEVTIKAGDTVGKAKKVAENSPYIVVGTSVSGEGAYSDVIYDKAKGEIILVADKAVDQDSKHLIMWIAVEQ